MVRVQGITKRAPRVDLKQPAILLLSDGSEWNVIILDVSSGGFRLQVPDSPRIGEFVLLRTGPDEQYEAQIRWALGDQAGGVFLSEIGSADWQKGENAMTGNDDRRTREDRRQDDRRKGGDGPKEPGGDKRRGQRRAGADRRD